MARTSSSAPKRVYVRMTRWRRRRFLMLLAECGTVRVAAELAGVGIGAVYRLRKKEPGFAAEIIAAKTAASARLASQKDCPDSPPPSPLKERGILMASSSGAGPADGCSSCRRGGPGGSRIGMTLSSCWPCAGRAM
jgi:hypothetical protein